MFLLIKQLIEEGEMRFSQDQLDEIIEISKTLPKGDDDEDEEQIEKRRKKSRKQNNINKTLKYEKKENF